MYAFVVGWNNSNRVDLAKRAQVTSAAKDDWSRAGRPMYCVFVIVLELQIL